MGRPSLPCPCCQLAPLLQCSHCAGCRKFLSQGGAQPQLPSTRAGHLGWLLSGWRGLLVLAVGVVALRKAGLWVCAVS